LSTKLISYHGGLSSHITDIIQGNVDVTLGGGELGQGFYLGERSYVAFAWAKQKSEMNNHEDYAVAQFIMDEAQVSCFSIKSFSKGEALDEKAMIKQQNQTRTYTFGVDMVQSPIIGGGGKNALQYKWESSNAQNYLNGGTVYRTQCGQIKKGTNKTLFLSLKTIADGSRASDTVKYFCISDSSWGLVFPEELPDDYYSPGLFYIAVETGTHLLEDCYDFYAVDRDQDVILQLTRSFGQNYVVNTDRFGTFHFWVGDRPFNYSGRDPKLQNKEFRLVIPQDEDMFSLACLDSLFFFYGDGLLDLGKDEGCLDD
jgi:hypothetical protein